MLPSGEDWRLEGKATARGRVHLMYAHAREAPAVASLFPPTPHPRPVRPCLPVEVVAQGGDDGLVLVGVAPEDVLEGVEWVGVREEPALEKQQ